MTSLENVDKVVEELMLKDDKNVFDQIFSKILKDIEDLSVDKVNNNKKVSISF